MSQQPAPDRTIRGFGGARSGGGVHPDASRLLARNRVTAPARPAIPEPAVRRAVDPHAETAPVARPSYAELQTATALPEQAAATSAVKAQINVMVPTDLRARIRSAYRATAAAEGHRSFSDFVATLLEEEAKRLEARHNSGQPFAGGEQPLTPGRPLDA